MTTAPLTRLQILAAQWLMIAQLIIANGRRFSRLAQAGAHGAEARAEAYEMQIRCALVVINRQIADVGDAQTTEDIRAMEALLTVQTCLVMLAMVAANMRAKLRLHSETCVWSNEPSAISLDNQTGNARGEYRRATCTRKRAGEIGPDGYQDSS